MCGVSVLEGRFHHKSKSMSILKDEKDIQKITSVIMDRFGNPFALDTTDTREEPESLSNIAMGVVNSDEITFLCSMQRRLERNLCLIMLMIVSAKAQHHYMCPSKS